MTIGIAVIGPHTFPSMHVGRLFPEIGFRYTLLEFSTDQTRADASIIPFGLIAELRLRNGAILVGLGRQLIPEEYLQLINLETWGDAFAGGSTLAFLEKIIIDSNKKESDVEKNLDCICRNWNARSALHETGIRHVPQELLKTAGLHREMVISDVKSHHLKILLQGLSCLEEDSYDIPYFLRRLAAQSD